ncbi:alpha/beta hydrolase [Nocardia amamiensis]|nr:alpha/beta fold hydrolase [Nocardia amamiensis]
MQKIAATDPGVSAMSLPRKALSLAAAPAGALLGAVLAFRMYHPPRREHHRSPEDFGLNAIERTVEFAPGKHIHLWLCEGDADRVVVLGHGVGLSKSASLAHAKFLHEAGYTVCLFDHRNHGASSADRRFRRVGEHFTTDIVSVVSALRGSPTYHSAKIALYGFSFSTFPSVNALTRQEFSVDAIVCDSGPGDDGREIFESFLRVGALPLPGLLSAGPAGKVTAASMSSTALLMLGVDWPPAPTPALEHVPALLISGGDDRIISPDSVRSFAGRYRRFRALILPGVEHLAGLKTEPRTYTETVLEFLAQALRVDRIIGD